MRLVAIIQARMGSSRLPGKVMRQLAGRPMLAHVVRRARAVPGVSDVVVATTINPLDEPLVRLCQTMRVASFRGDENDVLDRYYRAAAAARTEAVVRITADCPLLDPNVSGLVVDRFQQGDVDYASNTNPPTFPDGLDTEVFSFGALERAWRDASIGSQREHVTPYIWSNPAIFRLGNVTHASDLSSWRWTVDEEADLALIEAIFSHLGATASLFGMAEVVELLSAKPELLDLNKNFRRNEGYAKSLLIDKMGEKP